MACAFPKLSGATSGLLGLQSQGLWAVCRGGAGEQDMAALSTCRTVLSQQPALGTRLRLWREAAPGDWGRIRRESGSCRVAAGRAGCTGFRNYFWGCGCRMGFSGPHWVPPESVKWTFHSCPVLSRGPLSPDSLEEEAVPPSFPGLSVCILAAPGLRGHAGNISFSFPSRRAPAF